MSGHSKWHNIQQRKGKQDTLRSNIFSKLSKLISVSARIGGSDLSSNFSLRLAVEKAKSAGMPKDNIERAIKKGSGEAIDGVQVEEYIYEAYGPSGIAIIIKALSDNKNRTVQEVKTILTKSGGSFGGSGSVLWMFEQFGNVIFDKNQLVEKNIDCDDFELMMMDAGAEDIQDEDNDVEIKTKVENLKNVLDKLIELKINPKDSGLIWEAKDKVAVTDEIKKKLENIFEKFEENDDIENYFTNAE